MRSTSRIRREAGDFVPRGDRVIGETVIGGMTMFLKWAKPDAYNFGLGGLSPEPRRRQGKDFSAAVGAMAASADDCGYSLRNATMGSTRIARSAGTRQAPKPVIASATATAA